MNIGTCFLIGHRDSDMEVYSLLMAEVERHVTEYGVTDFYVGHYGGFDRLAAQAVKEAKVRHSEIRLTLVLQYHPAIRPIKTPKGFDGTFYPWEDEKIPKCLAITPEPECCSICENENGNRHHAPVLVNLSTGIVRELQIYDRDPRRPWEVAEEQRWDYWVFTYIDGNATMSWSSEDHTNIAHIGDDLGKLNPALFCHDCRALLAETASEGYVLLDMYDLENIQAFAVKKGAKHTVRDYSVSVYKDKKKWWPVN